MLNSWREFPEIFLNSRNLGGGGPLLRGITGGLAHYLLRFHLGCELCKLQLCVMRIYESFPIFLTYFIRCGGSGTSRTTQPVIPPGSVNEPASAEKAKAWHGSFR